MLQTVKPTRPKTEFTLVLLESASRWIKLKQLRVTGNYSGQAQVAAEPTARLLYILTVLHWVEEIIILYHCNSFYTAINSLYKNIIAFCYFNYKLQQLQLQYVSYSKFSWITLIELTKNFHVIGYWSILGGSTNPFRQYSDFNDHQSVISEEETIRRHFQVKHYYSWLKTLTIFHFKYFQKIH